MPDGILIGYPAPEYEEAAGAFLRVLQALPAIDGWKPNIRPPEISEIMSVRMDADELKEPSIAILGENGIWSQDEELREYRSRCKWKKRVMLRDAIQQATEHLNSLLAEAQQSGRLTVDQAIDEKRQQINLILSETAENPPAWRAFDRYLTSESSDASKPFDVAFWRDARHVLHEALDDPRDPVSVDIQDLSELSGAPAAETQPATSSPGESGPKKPVSTSATQKQCLQHLIGLMQSAPHKPLPKNKVWAEASGRFRGLSRRGFDQAWDSAIEATGSVVWRRPGPRSRA